MATTWDEAYKKYSDTLQNGTMSEGLLRSLYDPLSKDFSDRIVKIHDEIQKQGTLDQWYGGDIGKEDAAWDMAFRLAETGAGSLYDIGQRQVERTVEGESAPYSIIDFELYNKRTGDALTNFNRESGTFDTTYNLQFSPQGVPTAYTGNKQSGWVSFRENFLKPAALMAATVYGGQYLFGGGAGAGSAAAGDIAFAAADAAQLAAQGLGEAQIAQTLATTGLDAFVAADMAQLAAQGLNASQIASTVGATAAGTGGSLFNTLSPAQAVAQGVAEFPNAAGASNAAQAAGSAINAPATAATGTAATSGASGLLSSLTPAQLTSLLNAGVGLLGAGALGSAGGGGGGAVNVGALPQQAPPTYDQSYFDTLNRYYSTYLPGQQADTSMLQSWYNQQPMQAGGAVSGGMVGSTSGGLSPAAIQGQQVLGQQSNFNTLFNTLFGSVMGQQPQTQAQTQPATSVAAASVPTSPRTVVGPGDTGVRDPNMPDHQRKDDPWYLANRDKYVYSTNSIMSSYSPTGGVWVKAVEGEDPNAAKPQTPWDALTDQQRMELLRPIMGRSSSQDRTIGYAEVDPVFERQLIEDFNRRNPYNFALRPEDKAQRYVANDPSTYGSALAVKDIQNWWQQNQGKASQEELDRFLTLGYSPELIAQAVPQFGVEDLRTAISGARQRLQTPQVAPAVAPQTNSATQAIQDWYAQNQGGSQENLDRFLATSGYSAEMINQALPQFGVTDLQAAMANARQRLGL